MEASASWRVTCITLLTTVSDFSVWLKAEEAAPIAGGLQRCRIAGRLCRTVGGYAYARHGKWVNMVLRTNTGTDCQRSYARGVRVISTKCANAGSSRRETGKSQESNTNSLAVCSLGRSLTYEGRCHDLLLNVTIRLGGRYKLKLYASFAPQNFRAATEQRSCLVAQGKATHVQGSAAAAIWARHCA